MSQHDYDLANATGANFRTDANSALAAIVSNNSGLTEPSTMVAYQWWADTTTGLLKIRNAANGAWVTVGTLASANLGMLLKAGGTMTGALALADGLIGTPSLTFGSDTDSGIYWISANKYALVANGIAVLTFDAANYPTFGGTKGILVPVGTTAQRPTGAAGIVRYNSDLGSFEGYGTGWKGLGGAGGGAGFQWKTISGTAPDIAELYGEMVNPFGAGLAQEMYATIKVPQGYSAGTQILVYVTGFSASSSNTILFQGQSTLVRPGTDAFDSTTNQRTTTNSALTNTVAKQAREFILDVTDTSGLINGVAVAAGHLIKLRLYRGTDSDTADLNLIPNATDVKFS